MFHPPERLELPPEATPEEPGCELFSQGGAGNELLFTIKRTYLLRDDGRLELAPLDQQEPLFFGEETYEVGLPAPRVSPVQLADDGFAFREATDVVIQASAHAYGARVRSMSVFARFASVVREIRVHGARKAYFDAHDRPRFSEPEPFDEVPLRYDRAYGGQDRTALRRRGFPVADLVRDERPGWGIDKKTPYHYPRNPCGKGFLVELDRESFDELELPNLEFPFEPLTPERLAVGAPERWIQGPLPAGMDWQGESWFPRLGYLGLAPDHDGLEGVLGEIRKGFAPPDLLSIPSLLHDLDAAPRAEFYQGASPGMSVKGLRPDAAFELEGLHPKHKVFRFSLPGEAPEAHVRIAGATPVTLEPHLAAVVVRTRGLIVPERGEVTMLWCCRGPAARTFTDREIADAEAGAFFRKMG